MRVLNEKNDKYSSDDDTDKNNNSVSDGLESVI